ncbi:MAG: DEAD/DEAH box helicase [Proteobacteria bacterium]|nr:DEAD/DEAH box helicase [Pseudomonadota bacterium]
MNGSDAMSFSDLGLPEPLLQALNKVGYETPTPIQTLAIPHLLQGLDLLGHAPTGTGKTGAFALPLIARIDTRQPGVQVMTLAPTRELAIQVAEAFASYASMVPNFHVLPIYGGQAYTGQLRQLKRGVQVVVGTPGRIMDHMRKGTLKLDQLKALVLDEADEMLRMGFIEEVEWILDQTPPERQMALFSATMPKEVERIARRHLHDPKEISIRTKTATAETIRQRYWLVSGLHKLDALTRLLEVEECDATLVFVRTKIATTELAQRLEARGYSAAALNGDMPQKQREATIAGFKQGRVDILVATDVAARGLDVDRISHVINYDIPYDPEAYIHRIGRTGRAGRAGEAILFVSPRERRMLAAIEKASRKQIEPLDLPTTEVVNNKRIARFKQTIIDTLARDDLGFMRAVVDQFQQEHDTPALDIAAALGLILTEQKPLLVKEGKDRVVKDHRPVESRELGVVRTPRKRKPAGTTEGMEVFRIEVGSDHGVAPANIVGAIANEAGLDSAHIGHIEIKSAFSLVELPMGMPPEVFKDLTKAWVCGQQLQISKDRPQRTSAGVRASEDRKAHSKPRQDGKRKDPLRKDRKPQSGNEQSGKDQPGKDQHGKNEHGKNEHGKDGNRKRGKDKQTKDQQGKGKSKGAGRDKKRA